MTRSFFRFLTVPALLAFLMLLTIAAVPAAPAQPNQPSAVASSNAGEISVSWNAASGAQFYTVGWINKGEFDDMQAAGRDWLDAFHYATVPASYTSHTISGLKPSADYYAIVGAQTSRFGGEQPVWSAWSGKVTTSGEHGAGFCPVTGLPLPPTGYLSVNESTPSAFGVFTLTGVTKKATIRWGDNNVLPAPGRQYIKVCGKFQAGSEFKGWFLGGADYQVDTDSGVAFAELDDDVTTWNQDGGIPAGTSRKGCQTWDIAADASTVIIAINNWEATPQLYQVVLP